MSEPTDLSDDELGRYLVKHPAFRRYAERPHDLQTRDDCRGFQLALGLLFLQRGQPSAARDILRAVTYLWHPDIWGAIPPAPVEHVAVMPHASPLLFFFAGNLRQRYSGLSAIGEQWAYLVLDAAGKGLTISRGPGPLRLDGTHVRADFFTGMRPVLVSRLAFLASPCVMKAELRGERGLRRSVQRALGHVDDDPVYEVVLRRPRSQGVSESAAAHVEWSCQWAVRAHWRRLASGRLILVHPYWKGPADKPVARRHYRVER